MTDKPNDGGANISDATADHCVRVQELLQRIDYKPHWSFKAITRGECLFVQAIFWAPDVINSHDETIWRSRKWYVSPHMTDSEIVQTVFAMVLMAEEHEVRERFRLDGVAVLGPHHDLTLLAEIASRPLDTRLNKVADAMLKARENSNDTEQLIWTTEDLDRGVSLTRSQRLKGDTYYMIGDEDNKFMGMLTKGFSVLWSGEMRETKQEAIRDCEDHYAD